MLIEEDGPERRPLSGVTIQLTRAEAGELRDALEALLADPSAARHEHVSSADYQTEVTVWLAPDAP